MNKKPLILVLLLTSALVALASAATAQSSDYRIIVHPDNPADSLRASLVSKLFLKQVTNWSHGGKVRPVDKIESAPERIRFSDEILERTVGAVESYWQQQIYSGRGVPPVKVRTDREVVEYVSKNPGAIGYVSVSADLSGVKTVDLDR